MQRRVAGRFGLSFTEEDQEALAREAMASSVRGATRTALMNFLSATLVAALAWTNGRPTLAIVLLVLTSCAAAWRSTFRRRLYPRGPNPVSLPRIRRELSLNATVSGAMWATSSALLLPTLPGPHAGIYLVLLASALCTAVVHLSAVRGVAEAYVTIQLLCLAPFLVGAQFSESDMLLGVAALAMTAYGLIITARHVAHSTLITAGRLARGHAARRLLVSRRRGLARRRGDLALLERAEARALFVAKISHDLRTPLQIIASGTEILEMRAAKAAPALGVLDAARRIANASDRLIELAGELTDFLRWSAGAVKVRRVEVDLGAMVRRIADDLLPRAQSKGLNVRLEVAPAVVTTDPVRLRAILQNLLSNAMKYGRGDVSLSVECEAGEAPTIQVADQGPGLPESVLRHLGTPWNIGDPSVPRDGFGLGLYIVHSLSAELSLELEVSSSDKGTTFRLRFPVGVGGHES